MKKARNYDEVAEALRGHLEFRHASCSARYSRPTEAMGTGDLPAEEADKLAAIKNKGLTMYVVFSYFTPIAWVVEGEAPYIPDVKYSTTTSRHQGMARRFL